jgi:hypothetical protein
MKTIIVKRTIGAPADKVFDVLADHGNYKSFPGVVDSKLTKDGTPDRNGLGAVRHIVIKRGWFDEEITAYERPRRFDYRIVRTSLPLEHQGGSLRFEPVADGTEVTWTSTMRVSIPVIGGLLTPFAASTLGQAFGAMLKEVDRRLAA